MRTRTKFVTTTLAIGLFAWGFLGPHGGPPGSLIWPEPAMEPDTSLVPLFIAYSAIMAFAMGFGISYWAFGLDWTRRAFPSMTGLAHVVLGYIPASFWLHDTLHGVVGEDAAGIAALIYTFHLPMILAGVVLVAATIRNAARPTPTPAYAASS